MVTLKTPPMLQGNVQQQLTAQRDYLVYMQKSLEQALNNLNVTNFAEGTPEQKILSGSSDTDSKIEQQTNGLKQLIIKSADIVRSEMQEITAQLASNYVAQSEFGEYKESVNTLVSATASQIRQDINYDTEITNLQSQAAAFEAYRLHAEGHIKYGIVGYKADDTPIFGIAVAENVQTRPSGQYDEIIYQNYMSIFSADGLYFYNNNIELAHMTGNTLVITNAHIDERLEFGGDWVLSRSNGLTLKWVGA